MQMTNEQARPVGLTQIANTTPQRTGVDAAPTDAISARDGIGALILLFLASLAYVGFGGSFALEASPLPEANMPIATPAAKPANVGSAARDEKVPRAGKQETR